MLLALVDVGGVGGAVAGGFEVAAGGEGSFGATKGDLAMISYQLRQRVPWVIGLVIGHIFPFKHRPESNGSEEGGGTIYFRFNG